MRQALFLLLLVCLASCARQPLSPESQQELNQLGALSLLGDEVVIDLTARSIIRTRDKTVDAASWKLDLAFQDLLKEAVAARGKEFRELHAEPLALEKALGARESRYKRVVGKRNQALMELLFRAAEEQGIRYFFLLLPIGASDRFPLHRGPMGVFCYDRGQKNSRASVYFSFELTLWDVARRKPYFHYVVDPAVTEALTFGDCRTVAETPDLDKQLEDPFKKTASLLVDALFEKMGWRVQAR